jgi:hypothetical protein
VGVSRLRWGTLVALNAEKALLLLSAPTCWRTSQLFFAEKEIMGVQDSSQHSLMQKTTLMLSKLASAFIVLID